MDRSTTARVRREERRAALSRALVKLRADHDVTQGEISDATGASETTVQRWEDRQRPETPSIADVPGIAEASRPLARGVLAWAADQIGLLVVERREADGARGWLAALADVTDVAHGVTRALVDALSPESDGGEQLTARELDELEARAARAEVVLAELRERIAAERARRDGHGERRGGGETRGHGTRTRTH